MKLSTSKSALIFFLLAIIITACQPTGLSQIEQASTYAAQTKMAMPESTETPVIVETSESE